MVDIVTMGEAMACLVPQSPGPLRHIRRFDKHVAGAEFNLAIGAARLGLSTGWISRIGSDEFGEEIIRVLRGEGVDVSQVHVSSRPTGVYFKEYSALGEPRVYYYRAGSAASELGPDDVSEAYISSARALHVTGITPLLSATCQAAVAKATTTARQSGVKVIFDPNIRFKLISPQDAPGFFKPFLGTSDVVLAGESELRSIFGDSTAPLPDLEERVLDQGVSLVVIKRGAEGAVARTANERVEEGAYPVSAVVDPIGAGDGFDAGFLTGWLRGWNLEECLRLANFVGACATGVYGDYEGYPTWAEARAILDNQLGATR